MKQLNIIALLLISLFAFVACDDEDNYTKLSEGDIVKPTWQANLEKVDGLVVTDENLKNDLGTWQWTKAEFGAQSPVSYVIEIDTDASFGRPQEVARYTSVGEEVKFTVEQLNSAVQSFLPEGIQAKDVEEMTFHINLKAILGTSGNYAAQYAEAKTIKFTPMPALDGPTIYMIGSDFGAWEWGNPGIVKMVPVHSKEEVYWTVKYFRAEEGFKWAPKKTWSNDFFELGGKGKDEGFITKDKNAYVEKDGFYIVYIDQKESKIIMKPAEVFGIGDCFGGYDAGKYPFIHDNAGKVMTITAAKAGELRMYANAPVGGIDWWKMEFIILGGEIEYRGGGDDQERVSVDAGQTVTLDFNAEKGTIK